MQLLLPVPAGQLRARSASLSSCRTKAGPGNVEKRVRIHFITNSWVHPPTNAYTRTRAHMHAHTQHLGPTVILTSLLLSQFRSRNRETVTCVDLVDNFSLFFSSSQGDSDSTNEMALFLVCIFSFHCGLRFSLSLNPECFLRTKCWYCKLAVLPGARLHKLALHYSRVADPSHPGTCFFWLSVMRTH